MALCVIFGGESVNGPAQVPVVANVAHSSPEGAMPCVDRRQYGTTMAQMRYVSALSTFQKMAVHLSEGLIVGQWYQLLGDTRLDVVTDYRNFGNPEGFTLARI